MPVESAEDRAAFFNIEEFGSSVAYSHDGAAAVTLAGLFERPFELVGAADESPGVGSFAPSLIVRTADLPAGAGEGDSVEVLSDPNSEFVGQHFRVVGAPENDGTGMTVIRLETNS